jgi:hypothetical protein
MRRILVVTLLASLCQGCFVFEEIEKGQQIMDQHSPKVRAMKEQKEKETAASKTARAGARQEEEGGILDDLQQWWQKSREPAPPERGPDDVVVRCQIGGSMHFMRKSNCKIRGGRVI